MKSIQSLYFSESIKKMHHKRIKSQLEMGNTKMKKDIHTIIIKESGSNLFEYMELKHYMKLFEVTNDFILVGALTSYDEFTSFVTSFINQCLNNQISIEKKSIIDYLMSIEEFE